MAKYNLGRKLNTGSPGPAFADTVKDQMIFPNLDLSSREFPPVTTWQVGKSYVIKEIEVLMIGKHKTNKGFRGEFEVKSATV